MRASTAFGIPLAVLLLGASLSVGLLRVRCQTVLNGEVALVQSGLARLVVSFTACLCDPATPAPWHPATG